MRVIEWRVSRRQGRDQLVGSRCGIRNGGGYELTAILRLGHHTVSKKRWVLL